MTEVTPVTMPKRGNGKDPDDIARELGDDKLREIVNEAVEKAEKKGNKGDRRPLRFLRLSELLQRPPPTWLVRNVIPSNGFGVIYGQSGSGKTFAALDLAFAIATGRPWHGIKVQQGPVCYVVAEGNLHNRVLAYMDEKGVDEPDLLRVLPSSINLLDPEGGDIEELLVELDAVKEELGSIAMVVVDTLNRVMPGGNENASDDMGRVINAADRIKLHTGGAFKYVHHSGKNEAAGSRGHSSLRAACDFELEVRSANGVRYIKASKVKDGVEGDLFAFNLKPVDLGPDPTDPDERVVSCVVEAVGLNADIQARPKLTPTEQIIFEAYRKCPGKRSPPASCNMAPRPPKGVTGLPYDAFREYVGRILTSEERDSGERVSNVTARQQIKRGLEGLQAKGILMHFDDWVWRTDKQA